MRARDPRIFGIGLRKTGTRSLALATRKLGFRTMHLGGDASSRAVEDAEAAGAPLLALLGDGYDAYFDVQALVVRFVELDRQYPGSRFILSLRDEQAWLDSLERHVRANQDRHRRGAYQGSLLEVDRQGWARQRAEHHDRVRTYFASRPQDLLEIDVCGGGDGWERLAPFLGRRPPRSRFPAENRAGRGTYAPDAALAVAMRRASAVRGRVRRVVT